MTSGRPISVRLDREAFAALERVARERGLTWSEAIRDALVEASGRRRRRRQLAVEARALGEDEGDRREISKVAALMESLRGPR